MGYLCVAAENPGMSFYISYIIYLCLVITWDGICGRLMLFHTSEEEIVSCINFLVIRDVASFIKLISGLSFAGVNSDSYLRIQHMSENH